MKTIFASLAFILFTAPSSFAESAIPYLQTDVELPAQIQIFFDYQGYDNYGFKRVSTQDRPISFGAIANVPQAAACYKGDPAGAIALLGEMVQIYNGEMGRYYTVYANPMVRLTDDRGALQVDVRDELNQPFLAFPRMIECDRWATPEELSH